jgi:protein phosphatase
MPELSKEWKLSVVTATHIGRESFKVNQDALSVAGECIVNTSFDEPKQIEMETDRALFAIADGMSVHPFSHRVACRVLTQLEEAFRRGEPLGRSIRTIQENLEWLSWREPSLEGAGCTLAGVAFDNGSVQVFNVGDSRVYRLDGKGLHRLTRDHTQKERLRRENRLSDAQTESLSGIYNVLENYLVCGEFEDFFVDMQTLPIDSGEMLFLCSDGVSEALDDGMLRQMLDRRDYLKVFEEALANAEDNLSFIAVELR